MHSALGWVSKRDPALFVLGIQQELAAELREGYRAPQVLPQATGPADVSLVGGRIVIKMGEEFQN